VILIRQRDKPGRDVVKLRFMRVKVKGTLLQWARERADLGLHDLVKRFPRLPDWESGEADPTLKQLESFANTTHTPFGYLFLPQPPVEPLPIPDFRTLSGKAIRRPSPNLLDMIYACQIRQDWYRDYVTAIGEEPLDFVGSMTTENPVVAAAAEIRATLEFDLEAQRRSSTWEEAFQLFIGHAESAGIMVMCSGVVMNNNHRKLNPEEFRGFALADRLAPLVFINGADSKFAQMFTLAHEIAHLWLGQTALSDTTVASRGQNAVETWCNRVAAELLAPLNVVRSELRRDEELGQTVARLVRRFKVSSLVVLQRLRDARRLTWEEFGVAYEEEKQRLANLPRPKGGGDFYATTGARYSKRFARALVESTLEGRTLYRDAYRLLGISKSETFQQLGRSLNFSF
jgi:Zn-dependent peptidase ImmA (M78 family)